MTLPSALSTASPAVEQAIYDEIVRRDLASFIPIVFEIVSPTEPFMDNWHYRALAYKLMRVARGENHRLIVNLPPRSGKSIVTSVALPAYLLAHNPQLRIVCLSYSSELARKHGNDFRKVIESPDYQRRFPNMRIDPRKNNEIEVHTTAGGYRLSTSLDGSITGRGGEFILIDDPLQPQDAYSDATRGRVNNILDTTIMTRLNNKKTGGVILVMQRIHPDDPAGHLIEKGGWDVFSLPAIAEQDERVALSDTKFYFQAAGEPLQQEREPIEVLDRLKVDMGSAPFAAQYMQRPIPLEGHMIKTAWLRRYAQPPERGVGVRLVQSWDVAMVTGDRNDWSVCTTWLVAKNDYYLTSVFRARLEIPEVRKKVIRLAIDQKANVVLVEDAGIGRGLLQELERDTPAGMTRPIGVKPEGSKIDRMAAQSPKFEAGHVHLPENAPWLDTLLQELLAFPGSKHDDQVDSISQFLFWVARSTVGLHKLQGPIILPGFALNYTGLL